MAWFRKPRYTLLKVPETPDRVPDGLFTKCVNCGSLVVTREMRAALHVCPRCGDHGKMPVFERIEMTVDPGSFQETSASLRSGDPLGFVDTKAYPDRIAQAQKKTGFTDAIITGRGRIKGIDASLGFMNFAFVGGSMGSVVGEKVARCLELALQERIPAVLFCTSGGARMQEGILSLMQMAKTSAVVAQLKEARVPYIPVLTNPTTAGVMASFASLGDVIIAEPNALIGFAGPRVIEQTIRQVLPKGFQRSEFVQEHGFIDLICPRPQLRDTLANVLGMLTNQVPETGDEGDNGRAEVRAGA